MPLDRVNGEVLDGLVAVIIMRTIAGQERFVARDYDLPAPVIKSLLATTKRKHYEH